MLASPANDPCSNPLYLDLTWPEFQPPPPLIESNLGREMLLELTTTDSNYLVTSNAFGNNETHFFVYNPHSYESCLNSSK